MGPRLCVLGRDTESQGELPEAQVGKPTQLDDIPLRVGNGGQRPGEIVRGIGVCLTVRDPNGHVRRLERRFGAAFPASKIFALHVQCDRENPSTKLLPRVEIASGRMELRKRLLQEIVGVRRGGEPTQQESLERRGEARRTTGFFLMAWMPSGGTAR